MIRNFISPPDENPLQMSPRVRADVRDGLVTLNILNAVPEDSGVYRILVRNPDSEITCSCTVNVYQTIKPTATAPLFTSSVKGMNFRITLNIICLPFHVFTKFEVSSECALLCFTNF